MEDYLKLYENQTVGCYEVKVGFPDNPDDTSSDKPVERTLYIECTNEPVQGSTVQYKGRFYTVHSQEDGILYLRPYQGGE